MSTEGQRWLSNTRENLQLAIEDRLRGDPAGFTELELDTDEFQDFAYSTHRDAYLEAGLTHVGFLERLEIARVPEVDDLATFAGVQQVVETGALLVAEDFVRHMYMEGMPPSSYGLQGIEETGD